VYMWYTEAAARLDYDSPHQYSFNRLRKRDMILNLNKRMKI
jgi:hypothetical protein